VRGPLKTRGGRVQAGPPCSLLGVRRPLQRLLEEREGQLQRAIQAALDDPSRLSMLVRR
jgi:hypothetical protein